MSPLLVQLFRRLAALALLIAVLLLVLPRILTDLGVLGPTAEEKVALAVAALEAARGYGADEALPSYVAARKGLDEARALLQSGRSREARRAAEAAAKGAQVAQRDALVRRDAESRQAAAVVAEADRRLNELEALYTRLTKGERAKGAAWLPLMKSARQAGSGLILRYEQEDFARVLADREAAFAVLDGVRVKLLESAAP